jgi:SAM-dependent methyltransferase
MRNPLHVYAHALTACTTNSDGNEIRLRLSDGSVAPLALRRWLAAADATDEALLGRIAGPVLDVGCGPGRHLHALAKRGVFALGVDLSPVAVELARNRGANAIVGSIFDEIPGAGTWRTALLLDGNIGIGGAPERLLARIGTLLGDNGDVLVELDPPGAPSGKIVVRLETADDVSDWFGWARVAYDDIEKLAALAGYRLRQCEGDGRRWFAWLRRSPRIARHA